MIVSWLPVMTSVTGTMPSNEFHPGQGVNAEAPSPIAAVGSAVLPPIKDRRRGRRSRPLLASLAATVILSLAAAATVFLRHGGIAGGQATPAAPQALPDTEVATIRVGTDPS